MASLETHTHSRKKNGVKKIRIKSTRVDLTPMVDLGFLLLTFFVFTTTLSQPNAITMVVPKEAPGPTPVCNSCVLTLIPAGNNKIYYYEGASDLHPEVKITAFTSSGLRKLILEKKAAIAAMHDPTKELVLAIKPGDESSYLNFVNVIDEVAIDDIKHYFIVKPDEGDKKLVAALWK